MTEDNELQRPVLDFSGDVAQLQRQVRMLTFLFVATLLALVASTAPRFVAAAAADGDDEVLRIEGLVLVDKQGKTRGMWGVAEDGSAILTLNDTREEPRLVLLVDKQGHTEVGMLGPAGRSRGSWAAAANGESEIALFDNKGTARVGIKVNQNASAIVLNDGQGRTRTVWSVVGAGPAKKAELGFYDAETKRRLVLICASDGSPVIMFPDASNPTNAIGGWYVRDQRVSAIPKGSLAATLGR